MIVIVDTFFEGVWDSDKKTINSKEVVIKHVGIYNIGNSKFNNLACYINSVLQILLSIPEIKELFAKSDISNWISYGNKDAFKGIILNEFISILKNKLNEENKTPLIIKKFKEVLGSVNEQFKTFEQQDAQEFLNYILDVLHEELNLIEEKKYIPLPDKFNGTLKEKGEFYWSLNLRRNFSFIHALFLGQLRTEITCTRCNKKNITFEPFTSLALPIPQKTMIRINIVLYRLPFLYQVYEKHFESCEDNHISLKHKLDKQRKSSFEYDKILKTNDFSSKLNYSIPISLSILIDNRLKIKDLIEKIRKTKEFNLEENQLLTRLIVTNSNRIAIYRDDMLIKDSLQENQVIRIYEMLNTKGSIEAHIANVSQRNADSLTNETIDYINKPKQLIEQIELMKSNFYITKATLNI